MYPVFRFLAAMWKAKRKPIVPVSDVTETQFICRPWDIDMFLEMNNGRILTLFDIGRFESGQRTGLMAMLKKNKWGLVIAGSTVRYRKRIRMFNRVTIKTQVMAQDERWSYISQSMWVKGEPCCSVLLRAAVIKNGRTFPTDEMMVEFEKFNPYPIHVDKPDKWVKAWIDADAQRPWPP